VEAGGFGAAKVLHYHDSLWPHYFPQLVEMCRTGKPELYQWLNTLGPLNNTSPPISRTLGKVLKSIRTRKSNAFEAQCEVC
jgi:hypothetical protein